MAPSDKSVTGTSFSVGGIGKSELERLMPNVDDPSLTRSFDAINEKGEPLDIAVVNERAITVYLNSKEILSLMTMGDHPRLLAIGFLFNQGLIDSCDMVKAVDYDADLSVVVVRTHKPVDAEEKLKKRVQTSGCAQGTTFGDVMEKFSKIKISSDRQFYTSKIYSLLHDLTQIPSLYLKAGALHGCALCRGTEILLYVEDVGRHNAVDKIAGWMLLNNIKGDDLIFYTTGRLTSEMVIKTARMGIPLLLSRSGFSAWAVELARAAGLTIVGRAKGRRFLVLSGTNRLVFDAPLKPDRAERS